MNDSVINTIEEALVYVWADILSFAPMLLLALLVLIVGWIVAGVLKRVVKRVFVALKVNEALDVAGVDMLTERAGYKLDAGLFMGTLVKWFTIAVFFVAALDILRLTQVTEFVRDIVLGYLPHVIVAVLILMVAAIVANLAATAVVAAMRAGNVSKPELFGKVAYYAIVTFAVLAALNQLKIAPEMVQMLFAGLVFALSLALGLAFGLGGRETAARFLEQITRR